MPKTKRDIILDHIQYTSKLYASNLRDGTTNHKKIKDYLIPQQDQFIVNNILDQKILNMKQSNYTPQKVYNRQEKKLQKDLQYFDQLINKKLHNDDDQKMKKNNHHKLHNDDDDDQKNNDQQKHKNIYKTFEPIKHAKVAQIIKPKEIEKHHAILLLQRILRGRKVQNEMYKGKQMNQALIKKLRLIEQGLSHQKKDLNQQDLMKTNEENINVFQGSIISEALDFIAKEAIRNEQEKMLHLAEVAKQTNVLEKLKKLVEDKLNIYLEKNKKICLLNDEYESTATSYLNELIPEAINTLANNKANAYYQEANEYKNNDQEIVDDIIHNFLFKEVKRRNDLEQDNQTNHQNIFIQHKVVHNIVENISQKI